MLVFEIYLCTRFSSASAKWIFLGAFWAPFKSRVERLRMSLMAGWIELPSRVRDIESFIFKAGFYFEVWTNFSDSSLAANQRRYLVSLARS